MSVRMHIKRRFNLFKSNLLVEMFVRAICLFVRKHKTDILHVRIRLLKHPAWSEIGLFKSTSCMLTVLSGRQRQILFGQN